MKVHIGVNTQSGLLHSAGISAAQIHDSHEVAKLLHGEERRMYSDSAYRGAAQRERLKEIKGTSVQLVGARESPRILCRFAAELAHAERMAVTARHARLKKGCAVVPPCLTRRMAGSCPGTVFLQSFVENTESWASLSNCCWR
jgi:hypothetical protein